MFWHGRSFGTKLGLAVKFGIYKNIIFSLPQYYINLRSGMSGVYAMEAIYQLAYLGICTMDTWLFFILFEKDVSFDLYTDSDCSFNKPKPGQSILGFKMSAYYIHCRDSLNNWRKELIGWVLFAIITSSITTGVYQLIQIENGGILDSTGVQMSMRAFAPY